MTADSDNPQDWRRWAAAGRAGTKNGDASGDEKAFRALGRRQFAQGVAMRNAMVNATQAQGARRLARARKGR